MPAGGKHATNPYEGTFYAHLPGAPPKHQGRERRGERKKAGKSSAAHDRTRTGITRRRGPPGLLNVDLPFLPVASPTDSTAPHSPSRPHQRASRRRTDPMFQAGLPGQRVRQSVGQPPMTSYGASRETSRKDGCHPAERTRCNSGLVPLLRGNGIQESWVGVTPPSLRHRPPAHTAAVPASFEVLLLPRGGASHQSRGAGGAEFSVRTVPGASLPTESTENVSLLSAAGAGDPGSQGDADRRGERAGPRVQPGPELRAGDQQSPRVHPRRHQ
nr:uncharacterized protein LOC105719872 [Aotus nancymaae]XP_012311546.1 uncharacterized protein LOC105719872 [Aotus nancymaae]